MCNHDLPKVAFNKPPCGARKLIVASRPTLTSFQSNPDPDVTWPRSLTFPSPSFSTLESPNKSSTTTTTNQNHRSFSPRHHAINSLTMSAFDTAVADSKKLTSKPGNEELLKLYGKSFLHAHTIALYRGTRCGRQTVTNMSLTALFKVANGEDISKAPAPGMFDLKVRPPRSPPPRVPHR